LKNQRTEDGLTLACRVEAFIRQTVIPYEQSPQRDGHGPTDELVMELRQKAREAGVLTPHFRAGTEENRVITSWAARV
jgi:acyl-CoA dehydrogenase